MSDCIAVYVGLGSNMGNPEKNLERALDMLPLPSVDGHDSFPGVAEPLQVRHVSSVFRTAPQDYVDQPFFYNQVVGLWCAVGVLPQQLLAHLQAIEKALGREPTTLRFGPRVIDLDLLLFGASQIATPTLEVPHPRMAQRAFVLVPLAEVAPDLLLPSGMTVRTARDTLAYTLDNQIIVQ